MSMKVKLGEICNILNGYAFKSDKYVDEGIRVIRITNVQKGYIEDNKPQFYPMDEYNNISDYILQEHDLLLSLTGNVGRVAMLSNDYLPAALNQRVACLRIKKQDVLLKCLYYALLSDKFERDCISSAKGIAQKNMSTEWLKDYEIEVYSKEKQLDIIEIFDNVTNIINVRKQQLQQLDELVKARFVEMFGDPVENPMRWSTKHLQELVTDDCTISYGIVQTGDDQEEGVPVFRPVDIVNHTPIRAELKKTTEEISNKYKRTILKGREMLITVRANIADTYIVGEEFSGCNVGRGIVPIRTKENEMILEFLKYQIDSKHLNDNIKSLAKGITLIQLNMEDLREVMLIVPPIEQQKNFVEFAKQVDKSKVAVQKALDEAQTLFDSLMQEYFG